MLVAEDSDDDFFFLSSAFHKSGPPADLHRVRDGVEAIEYLRGENGFGDRRLHPPPELLVLDLKMPRKNGFEVLEWVKTDSRWKHLPVVILSSSEEPRDVHRAYRLGANSYLAKPNHYDRYQAVVRQIKEYWMGINQCPPFAESAAQG